MDYFRNLTDPKVQQFIRLHENEDENKLILKQREIFGIPAPLIAQQIVGRRKFKEKVPTYYNTSDIIYPPGLNLEQSSSEGTARYKLDILQTLRVSNTTSIDLTGGFGIDSFFLSQYFKRLGYVEPNQNLLEIARHNHQMLGACNINYHNQTAEEYLQTHTTAIDLIFIDPSRRSDSNQKIFRLSDGEPNIVSLREKIFQLASSLLIKASPLLDITIAIQELVNTKHVFVVSVNNECKELLFFCSGDESTTPTIHAINLKKEVVESIAFKMNEEQDAVARFSNPLRYLYEPNTSLLKAGAFKLVADRFNVAKLHVSTHLYTSDHIVEDFPGRIFEVETLLKSDSKIVQSHFEKQQANILVRNYPLSPAEIKKKFKLRDGGSSYLIGFSGRDQKYLAKCNRLK